MKSKQRILLLGLFIVAFVTTCKKDPNPITIQKTKLTGLVQKGPFINGTSITMYELNSSLDQTGNVFSTQISNNKGSFEINNIALSSQYVEFSANGYYFNEVVGDISVAPLALLALADITDLSTVNVNLLTHLEKGRVEYLVNHGKTFSEAKDSAQQEVLAIFGMKNDAIDNSEKLDISVNKDENGMLLAISIILQGNRSVGELTELLANITADIQEDGILNNESILESLRNSTMNLNLAEIRDNLQKRFQALGINTIIPAFEKYVNGFMSYTGLKPTVTTLPASNITATGATINGIVNANDLSTSVSFEYGTTNTYGSSASANQSIINGHIVTADSINLTGLSFGTTYHFRIKAENILGISYGNDMTFTTLGQIPSLTTSEVSLITNTSAIGGGNVYNLGSASVSVRGVCWSTFENPTIDLTTKTTDGDGLGTFTSSISGLVANTTYYVRAYATNSFGTGYGTQVSFTTTAVFQTGTVSDIEGYVYYTVSIGNQTWMQENLRTTKYNDGTAIPNILDDAIWSSLTNGAYCNYAHDPANSTTYGRLYNWYVIDNNPVTMVASNGGKNVCPIGWHVPNDSEWDSLIIYLGGEAVAGAKLKETGTVHWNMPNTGATNESGFTALPGGYQGDAGSPFSIGSNGFWWSTIESSLTSGSDIRMDYRFNSVGKGNFGKRAGLSVRCIKDK